MSKDLILVKKIDGSFSPAEVETKQWADKVKVGKGVRLGARSIAVRNLEHHKKFFALLEVTLDYWSPGSNMISPAESNTLRQLCEWVELKTGDSKAISHACAEFLGDLNTRRKGGGFGEPQASIGALLIWVKHNVNHCEILRCPDGIRKIPLSISFSKMSQEEFEEFYGAARNVCWKYILSNIMHDISEFDNAINLLLDF